MILCVLSIPLPFYIALPNKHFFYLKRNGQAFWIEPELANGCTVFSMTEEPLDWLGKDKESGVHFFVYWVKSKNQEVGKQQTTYTSEKTSDILGTVIYNNMSRVRIYFEVESKSIFKDEQEIEIIREQAHGALSHFIDVYGLISGDNEVHRFRGDDSYCSVLWWSDKYSIEDNDLNILEPDINYVTHLNPVKTSDHNYLFKKEYTELQKLSNSLNESSELSKHLEILLESRTLSAKKHYDLSIVLSETAFEVFLRVMLIGICQKAGVIQLPNRKNTAYINYREAIENGTIVRDLLRYLNLFSIENAIGDNRYTEWKKHTHDKRVDIVHKAIFGSTKVEADKANNSAVSFIQYISFLEYRNPYLD